MSSHSLRLRLLAGAGAWIALALLVAGAAIVLIFAASVERDQREDMRAGLDRVLTAVSSSGGPVAQVEPGLVDPRYTTPAGGLYWQVSGLDGTVVARSRSLWDTVLTVPPPPVPFAPSYAIIAGPADQELSALTQDVVVEREDDRRSLRVTVAEDNAVRGRDIRAFALDIGVALFALGAALVLAGWLQVHLGLRPLDRVRNAVEDVTAGKRQKLEGSYPSEVVPLIDEVNALLASQERAIAFARARADDLAHGLKTPLAVLSATAGRLRAGGDSTNAEVLDLLGQEMAERVDYQLRLAQLRVRSSEHALSASLDQALLRSVTVLRKTGRGEELFWKLDTDRVTVDMDPHDLMELIGVLLENAAKWAGSEVRIACSATDGMARFTIADDGPGLTEADIATLGERGKRLDEKRSGTGFGLSIAREILQMNDGTLSLSRSDAGGLAVTVEVPAAGGSDPAQRESLG